MNQPELFVGPFAAAHPGYGDIAHVVGFVVAGIGYLTLRKATRKHEVGVLQPGGMAEEHR
ncbi:hypothetical protein [Saccharopolyspora shandongensis]|uniref:hypothetical protein n=1 Tax=Saccharopolyspora shandongensis TaxID=418495 RepID=UPI0033FC875A